MRRSLTFRSVPTELIRGMKAHGIGNFAALSEAAYVLAHGFVTPMMAVEAAKHFGVVAEVLDDAAGLTSP